MNLLIIALDDEVRAELPEGNVLVVAPALNSRLRRWFSDEDEARRRAGDRAAALVDRLERQGVHAEARVGDSDPLLAIADALPTFPADEIVIAGGRADSTRLVSRARSRFALPTFGAPEALPDAA